MEPTHVPPSTSDAESAYAKYMLHDALAIRGLMRRLIDQRSTLIAADPGRTLSVVTAPLQVDAEHLWVDVPPDEHTLQRLLACERLSFEGRLERVTLRFGCGPAVVDQESGRPALRLPLPARLLHLQRREYVRLEPLSDHLRCQVPVRTERGGTKMVPATIRDIGGGGLAVLVPDEAMPLDVGTLLPGCVLDLPDMGTIEATLRVQHLSEPLVKGRKMTRAGCEFVDLPADAQTRLFRYIMQLDRAQVQRRRERERD